MKNLMNEPIDSFEQHKTKQVNNKITWTKKNKINKNK